MTKIDFPKPTTDAGPLWYAACTLPRHEKVIADRLIHWEVDTYLPLYRAVHRWNRRRAELDLPLFPGYLFVKMLISAKTHVLEQPGVVRLVSFNGKPADIPDHEIETLRSSLAICKAEPYPFLSVGKQIRIKSGPLAGLKGQVLRRKGRLRVIVSLEMIQRAVILELDAADAQLAG